MRRRVLLGALGLLMILAGPVAHACPLCLGGVLFAPGQQLDVAEQAVLAAPLAGGTRWRIIEVVKGRAVAGQVITEPVDGATRRRCAPAGPCSSCATSSGRAGPAWVRSASSTPAGCDSSPPPGRGRTGPTSIGEARVALVAPYLEHPEPLAALIAYGEIARAPYGALRSLKPRLDAATVARWLDDPRLAVRRPAYTLLLGIAGGPTDAERLEQRLDAAWASRDATNLGAMLAADLELRGPSRVAWIETMYLADRRRTMPEIAAALLALGEHGDENGAVPRARVIQAFLVLIKERKPMAGFVAQHLAEWEYWDAVAEYAALLASNVSLDPASRGADRDLSRTLPAR